VSKYRDFDAMWAENLQEPHTIKVHGKEYKLPPSIPAGVVISLLRAQVGGGLSNQATLGLAEYVFTRGGLDQMCQDGLTMDELGEVLKWVLGEYGGGKPDQAEEEVRILPFEKDPKPGQPPEEVKDPTFPEEPKA